MDENQIEREIDFYIEEFGISGDEASPVVSIAFSVIPSLTADQMRLLGKIMEVAARAKDEEEE